VAPYKSVFSDANRQTHAGMLAMLDYAIGNVTAALTQTGIADDAVILVTTDNGGPRGYIQPCGDCNGANNFPLRGGKHSLYEGGVRGTGFVWSRKLFGTSKHGRSWDGMAHIVDWLPTIASWMNVTVPRPAPRKELHGFDLGPALAAAATLDDSKAASPRNISILNIDPTCNGTAAVNDGRWKLILGDPVPWLVFFFFFFFF
jgi:arylsulfatase B